MFEELQRLKEAYKKLGYGGKMAHDMALYEYKVTRAIRAQMASDKQLKRRCKKLDANAKNRASFRKTFPPILLSNKVKH